MSAYNQYLKLLTIVLSLVTLGFFFFRGLLAHDNESLSQQIADMYQQMLMDSPSPTSNGKALAAHHTKLFHKAFNSITISHKDALPRLVDELIKEPNQPLGEWMASQLVLDLVSHDNDKALLRLLSSRCPKQIYFSVPTEMVGDIVKSRGLGFFD